MTEFPPKQNMHHFMSNSPWSGPALVTAVQDDIKQHSEFESGAMLILDESAEEKAGDHSAGAGRQHNGRLGKVEMSQNAAINGAAILQNLPSRVKSSVKASVAVIEQGERRVRSPVVALMSLEV